VPWQSFGQQVNFKKVVAHQSTANHSFLPYLHDSVLTAQQGKTLESPTGALFSSWLLDQIVCKMTHWMNLGFHLRLYQWSEYR
jgi:hypothetical protein